MKNLRFKTNLMPHASTVLILLLLPILSISQPSHNLKDKYDLIHPRASLNKQKEKPPFNHIPKKPGHYTIEDWQTVIDTTWGEGLPTVTKLKIFEDFWKKVDEEYPAFQNINVNWDSLYIVFQPEVAAGVSRGRFYAIMCQLFLSLQDEHMRIVDLDISTDDLEPGVPLLVSNGYWECGHFGAGLSPLPDSSLLVYRVVIDHPLGLQRGDIVLGYDGIPWKILYKEMLRAELPVVAHYTTNYWERHILGSAEFSNTHLWLSSAGMNWHLFDTIDILKYSTGDTLHLSTNLLQYQEMELLCSAQIEIPGVPMPDVQNGHAVSWGSIEGTKIGYIYTYSFWPQGWPYDPGDEFAQAIQSLMDDHDTKGLIIDARMNEGGSTTALLKGFRILFNVDQDILGEAERYDPDDHFALELKGGDADAFSADNQIYDKPIAVLTGPASMSGGDTFPLQMKYHPMARIFGLPTNGAFGAVSLRSLNYPDDWIFWITLCNLYLKENPGEFLYHIGLEADEEVWLTQEDVVIGDDTVVKRALDWINNLSYAHDVRVNPVYIKPVVDSLCITATVENPNQHELSVLAMITLNDTIVIDSCYLFNDGNHNDGSAGDSLWGGFKLVDEEQTYQVSVKTEDPTSGTSRTLPKVAIFTSVGPVVLAYYTITSSDTFPNPGDVLNIKLALKNLGISASSTETKARIVSLDTLATVTRDVELYYGEIGAGESAVPVFATATFGITIAENSPVNVETFFRVEISSNNHYFWSDTFSISIEDPTGIVDQLESIPTEFGLSQNYPNPFNPVTIINYELPARSEGGLIMSDVELSVYNLLGQRVATLVSERQAAGYHQVEWDATGFASGVYYYRLETGEFQDVKKMIHLR